MTTVSIVACLVVVSVTLIILAAVIADAVVKIKTEGRDE